MFKNENIFLTYNNHDDNPCMLIMVRTTREKKVERWWKEGKKKGWKKLKGLYVGESFAPSTFWIFGP
jgi:hypothetical protein